MFFRIVSDSFARKPRRKALTAAALALGMAVATATLEVALDVGDRLAHEFRSLGANLLVTPATDTLPLEIGGVVGQYSIKATVHGGGPTGQAGALRHAIARALVVLNQPLRTPLKKEGLLTRDSRVKERKKYGQKGARKRFQYSKR